MISFHSMVGERAFKEMRVLRVMNGESLPRGNYGFLEHYCDEADCDCRRVILQVRREDNPEMVWATINFGWESPGYYQNWGMDPEDAKGVAATCLEPFGGQSEHAVEILDLFEKNLLRNADYVERLKSHYAETKHLVNKGASEAAPLGNRTMRRSLKRKR